ncbi:hypothetical protein [Calothrix sp. PCC 7507]|uniref:hypothetical protein n=1 Tax=Calothrix sp. PCC 7507 TaxID=99598 RepID=UPI00029EC760|nr:hypothetical protein [Calothrix sp. PCC 7507]AFY36080.1 hypothetical protein Cal7507_5760 [Calothrix sp. PCC 7507]
MKNTIFHKVAAVAIGSLFAFSGTAFASTYKIGEITHATKLGNSEILVAQRRPIRHRGPLRDVPVFSKSVAVAETALGNAYAAAQSDAIGGPRKSALAESIAKATSLLGNATALSGSTAISDKKAVATSLSEAETVLGDALAIAQSDAVSGPGKPAIAKSLASAKTAVGNATAIATSSAQ